MCSLVNAPLLSDPEQDQEYIKQLQDQFALELVETKPSDKDFYLSFVDAKLSLITPADHKLKPIHVDFLSGKTAYRLERPEHSATQLAKALGLHKHKNPSIIDATAGFGNDGLLMAALGAKVTLIERNPIMAALLFDGLKRAQAKFQAILDNIDFMHTDSLDYIKKHSADIIYLDPMYPERNKSALGKGSLRVLKEVVGDDLDAGDLLLASIKSASKRVVVKRPKAAPKLAELEPQMSMIGKSTRFDVYLAH